MPKLHEFELIETVGADEMVVVRCTTCPWDSAPVQSKYVSNIKTRHSLANNWWPWTDHGKPESKGDDGTIEIKENWPFGEEE